MQRPERGADNSPRRPGTAGTGTGSHRTVWQIRTVVILVPSETIHARFTEHPTTSAGDAKCPDPFLCGDIGHCGRPRRHAVPLGGGRLRRAVRAGIRRPARLPVRLHAGGRFGPHGFVPGGRPGPGEGVCAGHHRVVHPEHGAARERRGGLLRHLAHHPGIRRLRRTGGADGVCRRHPGRAAGPAAAAGPPPRQGAPGRRHRRRDRRHLQGAAGGRAVRPGAHPAQRPDHVGGDARDPVRGIGRRRQLLLDRCPAHVRGAAVRHPQLPGAARLRSPWRRRRPDRGWIQPVHGGGGPVVQSVPLAPAPARPGLARRGRDHLCPARGERIRPQLHHPGTAGRHAPPARGRAGGGEDRRHRLHPPVGQFGRHLRAVAAHRRRAGRDGGRAPASDRARSRAGERLRHGGHGRRDGRHHPCAADRADADLRAHAGLPGDPARDDGDGGEHRGGLRAGRRVPLPGSFREEPAGLPAVPGSWRAGRRAGPRADADPCADNPARQGAGRTPGPAQAVPLCADSLRRCRRAAAGLRHPGRAASAGGSSAGTPAAAVCGDGPA